MNMTHYMELLADNQPWNLLIFMAVPVVLAETLAITELYILFTRRYAGFVWNLNRFAGAAVGLYFIGIIVYFGYHFLFSKSEVIWFINHIKSLKKLARYIEKNQRLAIKECYQLVPDPRLDIKEVFEKYYDTNNKLISAINIRENTILIKGATTPITNSIFRRIERA